MLLLLQVWIALLAFIVLTPLVLASVNSVKSGMKKSFGHNIKSYGLFVLQNLVSQSASGNGYTYIFSV